MSFVFCDLHSDRRLSSSKISSNDTLGLSRIVSIEELVAKPNFH